MVNRYRVGELLPRRVLEQASGHRFVARALLFRQSVHVAGENALRLLDFGGTGGDAEQSER